jgi:hypothetical protein
MEQEQSGGDKQTIRTMKSDADKLLSQETTSFTNLFAKDSENRRVRQFGPGAPQKQSNAKFIIATIVVLASIGIIGTGAYFYITKNQPPPKPGLSIPRSILNVRETEIVKAKKGDRTNLLAGLDTVRANKKSENDFTYTPIVLYDFTTEEFIAPPSDFFSTLLIEPPGDLLQNFGKTWNAYVYSGDLVLIFEVKNRLDVIGAMLSWEKTMPRAFEPLLDKVDLVAPSFEDSIIKNVDARIAHLSQAKNTSLGYSVVLGKYLIIATSESSLEATVERVIAGPINQ